MKNQIGKIPIFQVDAFTDKVFQGNPAAVCILEEKYSFSDSLLQKIAQEMNLSETAFIYVKDLDQITNQSESRLRWFTPNKEVKMCGHATLASAAVLFNEFKINSNIIEFETLSGSLLVSKRDNDFYLDFPISNSFKDEDNYQELISALGIEEVLNIEYCKTLEYLIVEVENDQIVENLTPNFQRMLDSHLSKNVGLVIVTSQSTTNKDFDFVSRCFAPWFAINEDPVTGSAHTILYPYWSKRLMKKKLIAYQCSPRGGILHLQPSETSERVYIIGKVTTVLRGHLFLD